MTIKTTFQLGLIAPLLFLGSYPSYRDDPLHIPAAAAAPIDFDEGEIEEYELCSPTPEQMLFIPSSDIERHIVENLDAILAQQEEQLGITYFGKPQLQFSLPAALVEQNSLVTLWYAGIYENNAIYLNLSGFDNYTGAKETLDHELGHFYTEKLHESWGLGIWPVYTYDEPYSDSNICLKLIDEGIAEYFSRAMNNGADAFKDTNWPISVFGFWENHVINDGGYHLVKPIIDAYGEEGIAYLISNPPTEEELFFLPLYQQQALDDLGDTTCWSFFEGNTSPLF